MTVIVNGLLIRDGHVLMAHRAPTRRNYRATWSFPGGHVKPGETNDHALVRELIEELRIAAKTWSPLHHFTVADGPTFYLFRIDEWDGTPQNIGTEHTDLRWMTYENAAALPALTFPIYAKILGDLQDAQPQGA